MKYKKEAVERFSRDLYATKTTGIVIEEVAPDYAKCSLTVKDFHLNAAGFVMGGALFTLADFAFAVASNCENPLTVTLTSQINYLSATKGPLLWAEARCVKSSKKIGFYEIEIHDNQGTLVAKVSATGYRKS